MCEYHVLCGADEYQHPTRLILQVGLIQALENDDQLHCFQNVRRTLKSFRFNNVKIEQRISGIFQASKDQNELLKIQDVPGLLVSI